MNKDSGTEILKEEEITPTSKEKKLAIMLMGFLVIAWGFEYIVAKSAMEVMPALTLVFLKYVVGFIAILLIKIKMDRTFGIRKKDIPLFILCSISGEVIYYYCEYTALSYMPISLVSIVLAFVPAFSILVERVFYKRRITRVMIVGIAVSIFGVALIIGVDFDMLFQGRIIGYLLAFGAVFSWNAYNFLTASLHEHYSTLTLTFTQLVCTILLIAPYAIHNMPALDSFTPAIIGGIIYLGVITAGVGVLILVMALHVLGPTPAAVFSNFLPITATFFGWLFLKESISIVQIVGGLIVISASYIVIKEKGKAEEILNE